MDHLHVPQWVVGGTKPIVLEERCAICHELLSVLTSHNYPLEPGEVLSADVPVAEGLIPCDCTVVDMLLIALEDALEMQTHLTDDAEQLLYDKKIKRFQDGIRRRSKRK
jgi:hypothetical protein